MQEDYKTVCVVEDMAPIRKLIKTILEKSGLNVIDFANGKSFIDWIKDNKPTAAIIDILLPDMNGTELLKYIRSLPNGNSIAVIAVTGFAQTSDKEKYIQMGFDLYFAKPINSLSFPNEIKSIIQEKANQSDN